MRASGGGGVLKEMQERVCCPRRSLLVHPPVFCCSVAMTPNLATTSTSMPLAQRSFWSAVIGRHGWRHNVEPNSISRTAELSFRYRSGEEGRVLHSSSPAGSGQVVSRNSVC